MKTIHKLILLLILIALCGCSQQFHEKKFYQKGGTFKCEQETITLTDTIFKDGKIQIVKRDSIVSKPVIEYVPKYVYRYKYLTQKLESKESIKKEKINAKNDVKINKQDSKTKRTNIRQTEKSKRSKWYVWLLTGIAIGFVLSFLIKKAINHVKTSI